MMGPCQATGSFIFFPANISTLVLPSATDATNSSSRTSSNDASNSKTLPVGMVSFEFKRVYPEEMITEVDCNLEAGEQEYNDADAEAYADTSDTLATSVLNTFLRAI
jgi:hypothetical protein